MGETGRRGFHADPVNDSACIGVRLEIPDLLPITRTDTGFSTGTRVPLELRRTLQPRFGKQLMSR